MEAHRAEAHRGAMEAHLRAMPATDSTLEAHYAPQAGFPTAAIYIDFSSQIPQS
jgi:hypothetical protein